MWHTLSTPWQRCLEEAWEAYRAGTVPIGACVVDRNEQVIGSGRNRILDLHPDGRSISRTILAHAEINALLSLDLAAMSRGDRHACMLYTTMEPCPLCMGAIYMAGMRHIYFGSRDPYAGSTDLLGKTPYLSRKPVKVYGPPAAWLEDLIMAMAVEVELRRDREEITRVLLSSWEMVVPNGVRCGRQLYQTGELSRLCAGGASVQTAVDWLAGRVMTGGE